MKWLLYALLPIAAQAQLAMYVVDGSNETPLASNSVYQLRAMEAGDSQTVRLRVRNLGNAPAEITRFFVDGTGFALNRPLPPQTLATGAFLNATLTFSAAAAANYSANLQMNGLSVLVLVSATPGPVLTIPETCASLPPGGIEFGIVTRGQTKACSLTLTNSTNQQMAVSTISTSSGFSVSASSMTLPVGQTLPLTVQFSSSAVGVVTGTLKIQNREYILRATSVNAALPAPIFEFETSPAMSGQQRKLMMRLPSPSPITATGQVNLAFTADSILAADDPAVMFVEANSRQAKFSVAEGQTTITFSGLPFTIFQTGTTAGRIRFTLSGIGSGISGDPEATVILAPSQIMIDKTIATRFPDRVEVVVTGFDNTFSAGGMSFRFFDGGGQPMTGAIAADFTADFRDFYARYPGGSMFRLTVRFPVTGNSYAVGGVEADVTNSAGTARTARLNF